MANNIFKPYKVLSSKLSSLPIKAGQFIITTDTNLIYVDVDNSTRKCFTPTKLSELTNDAGFLENFTESDPTVPTHVKNIKSTDITNWNNKSNFSGSYNDLTNKPTIPTVENNLTSTSTTNALSAAQGKALMEEIDATNEEFGIWMQGVTNMVAEKQDKLVSGTNIKSINGVTLLGSGNINTENTTYTFATGDSNGQIKVTPSGGSAQNISVKGLGNLAYKSSLSASDVGALASSLKGAASGVAELDANGKVPTAQLPSYVDDTVEGYLYNSKFYKESAHTTVITGETGKIYVDLSTNKTYRWSGSAFVEISASLALGTTSSTAFRGDYGNTAYTHATAKGSAFASGLYKITTNAQGHVTAATAVAKSDINNLGVPSIYVSSSEPSNMAAGDVWFVTE